MCEEQYEQNIPPDGTCTCFYRRFYLFFANMAAVIKVFSWIVAVAVFTCKHVDLQRAKSRKCCCLRHKKCRSGLNLLQNSDYKGHEPRAGGQGSAFKRGGKQKAPPCKALVQTLPKTHSQLRFRCRRSRWHPGLRSPADPNTASCPSPPGKHRN